MPTASLLWSTPFWNIASLTPPKAFMAGVGVLGGSGIVEGRVYALSRKADHAPSAAGRLVEPA